MLPHPGPKLIDLGNPVADVPLNRDRKAWWYGLPNYGTGRTLPDLTGRGHLTTIAGTPWHPNSPAEPYGNAPDFNGTSHFADTTGGVYSYAADLTGAMACWVRMTAITSDRTLVSVGRTANSDFYSLRNDGGSNRFGVQLRSGASDTILASAGTATANAWHRALAVMTATGLRFFQNGVEKVLTFATGTSATVTWFGNAGTAVNRAAIGVRLTATPGVFGLGNIADGSIWGPNSWACFDPVGFAWADYDESRKGYPTALRRFTPRTWVFGGVAAAGGDVTVGLTGQSATASAGTLAPSAAVALAGSAATSTAGTCAPSAACGLAGQGGTCSGGTVAPESALSLTGQGATATSGTSAPSTTIGLAGQPAASATGSVSASGGDTADVTVALTGQAATSAAGTLAVALALALSGSGATASAGTLTASGGTPVATVVPRVEFTLPIVRRQTHTLPVCRRKEF